MSSTSKKLFGGRLISTVATRSSSSVTATSPWTSGSTIAWKLAEGPPEVGRGLARQAELLLAQDVPLDLVGAARDRLSRDGHQDLGDDPDEGAVRTGEQRSGPGHHRMNGGGKAGDLAGGQLADRALRTGGATAGQGGSAAFGRPPTRLVAGEQASDRLAHARVGRGAGSSRPFH